MKRMRTPMMMIMMMWSTTMMMMMRRRTMMTKTSERKDDTANQWLTMGSVAWVWTGTLNTMNLQK